MHVTPAPRPSVFLSHSHRRIIIDNKGWEKNGFCKRASFTVAAAGTTVSRTPLSYQPRSERAERGRKTPAYTLKPRDAHGELEKTNERFRWNKVSRRSPPFGRRFTRRSSASARNVRGELCHAREEEALISCMEISEENIMRNNKIKCFFYYFSIFMYFIKFLKNFFFLNRVK